ncbi:MAG: phosphatidylglycerol lysyltransferase domain-containing protein, partial [Cyanobacteria bacterium]|nr:phosphatidylglycerol lysyltransferase domain-containing protein [Cyanobacteriota bacterium]
MATERYHPECLFHKKVAIKMGEETEAESIDPIDDLQEDIEYLENSIAAPEPEVKLSEPSTGMRSAWPVNLVAFMVFLSGLAGAFQPLANRLAQHPRIFSMVAPYEYYHFSKSLNVAVGAFLIYLSLNLYKRKRMAWLLALVLLIVSIVLHAASWGHEYVTWLGNNEMGRSVSWVPMIAPVLTVVLLIFLRNRFTVLSEKIKIKNGLYILAASLVMVFTYGAVGFWLLERRDLGMNFQFADAVVRSAREMFFIGNPDLTPHTRFGRWFIDSLHLFGTIATAYATYSIFRPIRYRLTIVPKERSSASDILDAHGRDSLDHYKLLPDKSYFFAADRKSFIAYKTVLNVAIGLGDPGGADADVESLTRQFQHFCHLNDWTIAFLQVSDRFLSPFEQIGLDTLKVGEDAVVNLDEYAAKTAKGKNFKSKGKKFEKDGFKLVRYAPPHSVELVNEVETISNEWLSLPGRRERGFSLGWFDREELQEETLFVLRDPEGKGLAFVNQVRSYRKQEASIDMMRHRTEVPNGTMDFLFWQLLLELHSEGYKTFNLGLAALSGVEGGPDASLEERAVHQIYEHMNRFFSYKGLRRY